MTPKQMLERVIAGSQRRRPQPITDEFAIAIGRKLESCGIAKVPGLPAVEETYEQRVARVLKQLQSQRDEEERAATELEAAQDEHTAPQTTAGTLRQAISESVDTSGHMPLNGVRVLRAALASGPGTINGEQE